MTANRFSGVIIIAGINTHQTSALPHGIPCEILLVFTAVFPVMQRVWARLITAPAAGDIVQLLVAQFAGLALQEIGNLLRSGVNALRFEKLRHLAALCGLRERSFQILARGDLVVQFLQCFHGIRLLQYMVSCQRRS